MSSKTVLTMRWQGMGGWGAHGSGILNVQQLGGQQLAVTAWVGFPRVHVCQHKSSSLFSAVEQTRNPSNAAVAIT